MRILILIMVVLLSACSSSESVETVPPTFAAVTTITTIATTTTSTVPLTTTVPPATTSTIPEIPEAPDGFERFAVPDTGLTILAPDSFRAPDFSSADPEEFYEESLEKLTEVFEGAGGAERAEAFLDSMNTDGGIFWAIDLENATEFFVPTVEVREADRLSDDTPDGFVNVIRDLFESLGATSFEASNFDGRSVISEAFIESPRLTWYSFQLAVFGQDQIYNVSYAVMPEADEDYLESIRYAMLRYTLDESVTYE